jgi:hypothetical protein
MGRFWAATRVVALFIMTLCCSSLAHGCEACERVPLAAANTSDVLRHLGRVDVTAAVDTATSFIVENTGRSWRWFARWGVAHGEVDVAQLDSEPHVADISNGSDVIASAVDYLSAYQAGEPQQPVRMPSFRREHKWALTYRSDAAEAISQPAQSDRFPAMNTTLDDSVVLGLRFEWEYGWTR